MRLHGGDVIHSFWVPKLSGKTDAIPGQTNLSWMQASRPGRYRGQCSEYCGLQHAHMGFEVVAETRADFERWRRRQLQPAPRPRHAPRSSAASHWSNIAAACAIRCAAPHAGAVSAPDLTHLMSRRMIAAGTLLNNPGNLAGWIEDPQDIKPGTLMPNQYLSAQQLSDVRGVPGASAMRAADLPHAHDRHRQRRAPGATATAVGDARRA